MYLNLSQRRSSNLIGLPSQLNPKFKAKYKYVKILQKPKTTLFTHFRPKPGGQEEFWQSVPFGNEARSHPLDINPKVLLLKGGIGGGKSFTGAAFACTRAYFDTTSRGLITANEYGQLETSTLVALAEFCELFHVPLSPQGESPEETAKIIASRRLCRIFNAPVLVLSANKFGGTTEKARQGGRGLQIRWFWADEYLYADQQAFETLLGRLGRGNGKLKGLGLITSSLNRNIPYNYAWTYFDDPDRNPDKKELFVSYNCLTKDNDALSEDYVRSLEATYTPELAKLELCGEYAVSVEGRIFKYFERNKHIAVVEYDPAHPLHVSFDFNRSPACAIITQNILGKIIVLQEFYLINSDTFELAQVVSARLRSLSPLNVYIYGDASGNQQTANSKTSNWSIVHNAIAGLRWQKCYGDSNPSIVDSINSCNCLFIQDKVVIHPDCKEIIKDFEFLKDDGNQGIDKKKDPMRSHLADAFRYLCHRLYPYRSVADLNKRVIAGGNPLPNPFR